MASWVSLNIRATEVGGGVDETNNVGAKVGGLVEAQGLGE